MKVVRIIARLNVGGPARHVAWLSAGLVGRGVETVLVAGTVPPGEDDMGYFSERLGVRPHIIPEMSREVSPKDAVTVWKLYRLLRRERPDVVHTHTAKAGTVGRVAGLLYRWLTPSALWGRPRGVRFVHTYHGHVFHSYYGPRKTRLFLAIERALARFCTDRVVVISPRQLEEIGGHFRVGRPAQFAVIPLGLDTRAFAEWAERRPRLRRELGALDDEILVGIVGRLTEIKNHALLLSAAEHYKRHAAREAEAEGRPRRRVRFVVVGDGLLRAQLEAQAASLGIGDDVVFLGTRDDPEDFYPALDVVALTSLNEGTPLTLVEAMANARPVVATAVGGVPDLLGGLDAALLRRPRGWQVCERGVLVEQCDAESFSRALDYLIENEGLRLGMGARGLEFAARRYSVERLLADIHRLYEELIDPAESAAQQQGARAAGPGTDITRGAPGPRVLKEGEDICEY